MKKRRVLSALALLTGFILSSCNIGVISSDSSKSYFNETQSQVETTETTTSKEESTSTSSITSVSTSSSSSSSSRLESTSSSGTSSSLSSSSSSLISGSVSTSSSSSSNSSSSQTSSSSSSSSSVSSSSSTTTSSSQNTSSSSASSSSSSEVPPDDPLKDYQVIDTFLKRMPGEFEPCAMVKMCYPNNMPLSAYKAIANDNKVLLLCNPDNNNRSRITRARSELNNAGVNVNNVTFIDMPIDSDYGYWVRDFSPFYVFLEKQLSIVDFTYNRPRYQQNAVPGKLANYFSIPYSKMPITHTGGNLMQDGRGTAFSDDLVISENDANETNVRNQMRVYTGTDNYVITIDPQGDYIAHIDCWGKIVAPDKIIVAKLPQSNPRYRYYEQVANELANTKCAYGYNYRIYRIEEPGGNTVAPYTNSLIVNGHVYMPLGDNETYNQKALEVYHEALPGYDIQGIQGFSSNDYYGREFLNTDALHCRTHEVPDQNMVFIDSREVYNGEVTLKDNYVIKANVVSYSNEDIDNVTIHYSVNDNGYLESPMNQYKDTSNYTFVFQGLHQGDDVKYYIDASDAKNNYNIDPTCGSLDPHHFIVK